MFDFEEALKLISQQTILCVGDLMLDDFVYGEVTRISPEAPTPVLAVARSEIEIGGAGNVARNIAALGARCLFVGLIGKDEAGRMLTEAFRKYAGAVAHLVAVEGRHTTRKVRFVSEHHSAHLMRADWETARPVSTETEAAIIAQVDALIPQVGAVVLSDYAKGVLTPRVIRAVIDGAKQLGKPVIVDPKGHDYSVYRGATLITPNRQELGDAVHRPVVTETDIATAAAELARIVESDAVLVTLSEGGMTLHVEGQTPLHIPAYPVKVRDVSGAGDTVAAVMAVLLAMKAPFDSAMRAANAAAAVVVGKRGTATVSLVELRHRILPSASLAPKTRLCSTGRCSTSVSPNGAGTACASVSPTAASTYCIVAIRNYWPKPAPPATGWSSASTATPQRHDSKAQVGPSIRPRDAPRCLQRSKPSIWSWFLRTTRPSNSLSMFALEC
jgi:D-beta-D-heptose 7-phosphate kinase/D-beta-D-heptose 1-phosphate adenosyltransferase